MEGETGLQKVLNSASGAINDTFSPLLRPIFQPIDSMLAQIPPIYWTLSAIGLFVATMVWVFMLKKEYVCIDSPGRGLRYDLRVWTIVSMLPHVVVYLYFGIKSL